MISVYSISLVFIIGLFLNPIIAVLIGIVLVLINPSSYAKVNYTDLFILIFMIVVSTMYLKTDGSEVFKEIIRYIIGPFIFYFLGKSSLSLYKNHKILLNYILAIFSIFCVYTFFKNTEGEFSLNLEENYYYMSRNSLLIKAKLEYIFINETNLSLLVLTCLFLGNVLVKNWIFRIIFSALACTMLFILSSRMAISVFVLIILFNFLKYNSLKSKFAILAILGGLLTTLLININIFDIPYINTFFYRLEEKSFSNNSTAFGLNERFVHYYNAANSSNILDINGYKYLLNNFGFSSHNEILGHTSAIGIIPALFFFSFLYIILKKAFLRLSIYNNSLLRKILEYFIISYIFIGLTENLFISNTVWFYLFMLIIGVSSINNFSINKT